MGFFRSSNSKQSSENAEPREPQRQKQKDHIAFDTSLANASTARVDMHAEINNVDPELMWLLLSNPHQHNRIFKAIEGADARLLEHDGPRKKYELDYSARWQFWKVSGVCKNELLMDTDADKKTVSFKLRSPGFLRIYEGTWSILPLADSVADDTPASLPNNHSNRNSGSSSLTQPTVTQSSSGPSSRRSSSSVNGGGSSPVLEANLLATMTNPLLNSPMMGVHQVQDGPLSSDLATSIQSLSEGASGLDGLSLNAEQPKKHTRATVRVSNMLMSPNRAPPYPLNGILKGQAVSQVQDMLDGLLEACRNSKPQ